MVGIDHTPPQSFFSRRPKNFHCRFSFMEFLVILLMTVSFVYVLCIIIFWEKHGEFQENLGETKANKSSTQNFIIFLQEVKLWNNTEAFI